jgi:hypothetical protein
MQRFHALSFPGFCVFDNVIVQLVFMPEQLRKSIAKAALSDRKRWVRGAAVVGGYFYFSIR